MARTTERREASTRSPSREQLTARARRGAVSGAAALMNATSYGLRRVPARGRYAFSDAITTPLSALLLRRRPVIERNFAAILDTPVDDPRVRRLARASIVNFGRMAIDFLTTRTMSDDAMRAWVRPSGEDHLREALDHGRGVILALQHHGSWDVAAAFAQDYGCQLTVVVENNWMAELVAGARTEQGVILANRDRSLRALFRALSRNECVAMLCDIARGDLQTVDVPFFGRPAPLPLGPARLACHTDAPILVVSCTREADNSYRIDGQPLLWGNRDLPTDEAAIALTAALAERFEGIVRDCPAQWYPFHPIWSS